MQGLRLSTVGMMGALMAVSACDRPGDPTAASAAQVEKAAADAPTAQEQAIIDSTPQVSLSAEDRAAFRKVARDQLDVATEAMGEQGYTRAVGYTDEIIALLPTQKHVWEVKLKRGIEYRIVGGCDQECSDFDLELLDASGKLIERDTLPDDYPILNVAPATDAAYSVRFVMKTCTIAPCYAGARVFRRTGPDPSAASEAAAA